MRFLHDQDYTALLRNEIRGILVEDYTDTKLYTAEGMAIAQIKNYFHGKYDNDLIFAPWEDTTLEDPRDAYIVMITIDCTLYHLYTSLAPNKIPEHRSNRYQDALNWLEKIITGMITPDLPRVTDEETGEEQVGFLINSEYQNENNRW